MLLVDMGIVILLMVLLSFFGKRKKEKMRDYTNDLDTRQENTAEK